MNEKLYPGKQNPDLSYEIDLLLEDHNDILSDLYFMTKPDCTVETIKAAIDDKWIPYFTKIEERLNKSSGKFLVAETMSIADIVVGSYIMRFVHNPA